MQCPNCHQVVPDTANVCGFCGTRLRVSAPIPPSIQPPHQTPPAPIPVQPTPPSTTAQPAPPPYIPAVMPAITQPPTGNKNSKSAKKLDGIQIAGIGVIVLIAVAAIWMLLSNRKPADNKIQAPQVTSKQYASEPPMTIDVNKQYLATVKMAKGGEFVIQLYADKAPRTVNSFVFLANDGFFNGTTFHRVLDGFMAQGGDPTGTGGGGPGYEFVNEKNDLAFDKPGVVAMANAGPNTNGSQFFIMFGPYGLSESDYTIFGQVISGMDVVNGITRRDPDQNPTFPGDAMESVTITEK